MTEPVAATAPPTATLEAPPPNERTRSDTTSSREVGHGANPDIKTLLASPTISIQADGASPAKERRPSLMAHIALHSDHNTSLIYANCNISSAPAAQQYQSPLRHHKRTPSQHREVKETLNARSEYTSDDADGTKLRINQYIIREEIGRGSYGAVHVATDQFGAEFAIKEFSKSRLRKRAQSNILRRPPGAARPGRFPGRSRRAQHDAAEAKDALFLIREEIAIMKKLNHPNLVQLIEVLDDPEEDSLWMVLEMCKKGVVMKVGLDDRADPYPEEQCRHWFRDLILGIEYLHAQGVIHRDIKPDNLLLTEDDVLKIVDFGVSEIFEKPDTMITAKSAGSPAFLPPELCIVRHGDVSGKAADIWAMGVTLYCLKYGKLPYKRDNVLDMYEAIRNDQPEIPEDEEPEFRDLITRLLDKDASTRICMSEIREHPWVTLNGSDPLLSEVENCSDMIELPNDLEVNHAFTPKMSNMLTVMMAINKFKGLLARSRPSTPGSRTPRTPRTLQIPSAPVNYHPNYQPGNPVVAWNDSYIPKEPEHKEPEKKETEQKQPEPREQSTPPPTGRPRHKSVAEEAADIVEARKAWMASQAGGGGGGSDTPPGEKGHAHEPTDHSPRLLGIGLGGRDEFNHAETPADIVSDSPTGIDFNLYDRAFEAEIERIRAENRHRGPDDGADGRPRPPKKTAYLTRFVNEKEKYFGDDSMILAAGRSLPGLASSGMNKASAATVKALERMHLGGGRHESGRGSDIGTPTPEATAAAAAAMAKGEEAKKEKSGGEEKEKKEKGEEGTSNTAAHGAEQQATNDDNNANKTMVSEEPMTISESYENVKESVHKFADVVASTMQQKLGGVKGAAGASKE
ncbi:uncharacterized protein PG986_008366 [Apiospora aurea]|uniref:Protein kinase domain-containing protein n=1 Tax=Apiospora aurea TaxID=335848 RepID=A0ABR1QFK1_9PEZI